MTYCYWFAFPNVLVQSHTVQLLNFRKVTRRGIRLSNISQFEHVLGIGDRSTFRIIVLGHHQHHLLAPLSDQLARKVAGNQQSDDQGEIDKKVIERVAIHCLISQILPRFTEIKRSSLIAVNLTLTLA